jgi:hypothetical protein
MVRARYSTRTLENLRNQSNPSIPSLVTAGRRGLGFLYARLEACVSVQIVHILFGNVSLRIRVFLPPGC